LESAEAPPPIISVFARRRAIWLARLALLTAVLAIGTYFAWQRIRPQPSAPGPVGKRVMLAVLPLENLSRDPDQEYFSDGLTEEMITQLGRLNPERLGVIARASTVQYKGTKKRVDEIGRELGVGYILEGSVRREADRVRISAQLIRVSDQTHLWADNFERDMSHVLALQNDVARVIASEIIIKLTPEEQTRSARLRPVHPEAYDLYLKGRYFWNKRSEEGLRSGIGYFQQALEKDPTYAPAYAGLADSYVILGSFRYGFLRPSEAVPKARAAAAKAMEIDDRFAEVHTSLGWVKTWYEFDWPGAEAEYRRALQLSPNYATAHDWYALYLAGMARNKEALDEIGRAQELDPLSPAISGTTGVCLYYARRYDEAIQQLRKTLEIDPNFAFARLWLSQAYIQKGLPKEALVELEKARALLPDSPVRLMLLGYAYGTAGKKSAARRVLSELQVLGKRKYVSPLSRALVHAALGDKDRAFQLLEEAYQERASWLAYLRVEEMFDPLRSDPRFQDLLRRMNLPPDPPRP
jgi:TolB-like protein/Tfp pilus assembly protein PilF